MRILITGAGGQLGRDLLTAFPNDGVHGLDHRGLDITERDAVGRAIGQVRPDWIINAAAFNDVDGAEVAKEQAFAVNAMGAGTIAEAAQRAGARLIHISTDYVFDGTKGSAYIEDDLPNPLSVYGSSKLEGERRVFDSGARVCVLRTAWLYGVQGKNFVKAIIDKARRGGSLEVVADQVGSPTYTADLADGIRRLVQTDVQGLFHVVNSGACSRFEFAKEILGGSVEVRPITTVEAHRRAPRPANSSLTSVRWSATGLPALRPWRAALKEFLSAYAAVTAG
jgi:dTDP-4-dehydrorhamnose reductase